MISEFPKYPKATLVDLGVEYDRQSLILHEIALADMLGPIFPNKKINERGDVSFQMRKGKQSVNKRNIQKSEATGYQPRRW